MNDMTNEKLFWKRARLKLIDGLRQVNKTSRYLRILTIGGRKIYLSEEETRKVLNILQQQLQ